MATIEKEKALDVVRQMVADGQVSQELAEKYFPELKESEDEKMRAMAIKAVYAPDAQSCIKSWGINPDDVIAWLEKQGKTSPILSNSSNIGKVEQKPALSEEDETTINNLVWAISNDCIRPQDREDYCDWLKSLKERYTWKPSEEQIKAVRLARSFVTDDFAEHPTLSEILVELEKQLKKLKEE